MSEFVISGVVGDKESFFVAGCGSADDSGASDGGLDDGNEGTQLTFKDGVEVIGSSCCYEAVSVGKFGKDANIIGILVLYSVGHVMIIDCCFKIIKE